MHKDFYIREEALRDVLAIFDSKFRLKNTNRKIISDTSHYRYSILNDNDEIESTADIHILYAYTFQNASEANKYKWQFNLQQNGTMELIESMKDSESNNWIIFCGYLNDELHIGMFRFNEIWDYIKYKTAVNVYYDRKERTFRVKGCTINEARCNFQAYHDDFSAALDEFVQLYKGKKDEEIA